MSFNIFEIWDKIGRQTPFAVRRDHWSSDYYAIVEKIECEKLPYGKAFGYPTINGQYSNRFEYDKQWLDEKLIPCSGCYQWTLAENAEVNAGKAIAGKTVTNTKIVAYSFDATFDFGKYKGIAIERGFQEDPQYVMWALVNVDKFCLTKEAILYLEKINPKIKFNEGILQINEQKFLQTQKRSQ